MKNKLVSFIILAFILCSCVAPVYLPKAEGTGTNPYGSQITLSMSNKLNSLEGELIAIDEKYILVLVEDKDRLKLFAIEKIDVEEYELRYAKAKDYLWTIPTSILLTASHGFMAALTMPLNIVVTSTVAYGAENSHTYNKVYMKIDELKPFARFPQGVPSHISLDSLQNTKYIKSE